MPEVINTMILLIIGVEIALIYVRLGKNNQPRKKLNFGCQFFDYVEVGGIQPPSTKRLWNRMSVRCPHKPVPVPEKVVPAVNNKCNDGPYGPDTSTRIIGTIETILIVVTLPCPIRQYHTNWASCGPAFGGSLQGQIKQKVHSSLFRGNDRHYSCYGQWSFKTSQFKT